MSANYEKVDVTDDLLDHSFPYLVNRGNEVILSYFKREHHNAPTLNGQRVARISTDGGLTFSEEKVLPDGVCYTVYSHQTSPLAPMQSDPL